MFNKQIAKNVLSNAMSTGADFAEIFFEDTYQGNILMYSGKVDKATSKHIYGAGIRIIKDGREVYGYTSKINQDGLLELSNKLKSSFNSKNIKEIKELKEECAEQTAVKLGRLSKDVDLNEKILYLNICNDAVKDYSPLIVQYIAQLSDTTQEVIIANTNGKYISDTRNQQRIYFSVIAEHNGKKQSNGASVGGNFSIDGYKEKDLVSFAKEIAESAVVMVDAPEMVGGVYPVVIHNGFGGVLFHEACGHPLEASAVARGMSVFTGKKGEKIASSVVTAIDDGTIFNEWGSTNIDDEGNKTTKNVLIKDGILTNYMVDEKNGKLMNMPSTGASRRESYKYSPTSRMTNTYIANGKSTFEEIIAATEYGLFAKSLGGGSVNPATGEFNFAVNEGYMIEHGKITHPVRGATLVGNGANALLNIDMVANNQTFGHGVCGASSGSIPANVGEPTIRILNMTVGGNGGKK